MYKRSYEANGKAGWNEDIRTAKELCYPRSVIQMLKEEPDQQKRTRILHDARLGILK